MDLSRVDRVLHTIDPAKLSATGLTATGVTVALLPVRSAPTSGTVWVALTNYSAPTTAKILLAGPDASSTGALVVTADCDLWALVTDGTQTEAVKIERINLEGSSGTIAALPLPLDQQVAALLANRTSATYAQAIALPTDPNGA